MWLKIYSNRNMNAIQEKNGKPCVYLTLLLLTFVISVSCLAWCGMFDVEDLHHCISRSIGESLTYVRYAYEQTNPRLGEYAIYMLGTSADGVGSYYAQMLHYVLVPVFQLFALLLVLKLGVPEERLQTRKSCWLVLLVILCIMGSKQNYYWQCGNMCWLYPCVAAMLLFVFWEGIFKGDFKVKAWKFLLSLPLAVVVGMSNENTSLISLLLFVGSGVYACVRQRRICVTWQYVVVAVLLLASALVFYTAPCRACRAATAGWELSFHNILFHSLLEPINWAYTAIFYWREAMVLGVMVYIGRRRGVKLMDRRLAFMILVMLLLWGVLWAAPCWGAPRAYTPLDLMLFAIMARLLYKIVNHERTGAWEVGLILSLRAALTLTVLVPTVALAVAQYKVRCQIAEHAEAALARGETRLVLREGDIDTSPVMRRYFNIPGFVVAHDLKPYIPLVEISKNKYENKPDFTHHAWTTLAGPWYPSCGDDVLNRGVAKRFGLDSIIYVR